jgi:hypothetical protein
MQGGSNTESTLLIRISHPHSPTNLTFIKETVSAKYSELTVNRYKTKNSDKLHFSGFKYKNVHMQLLFSVRPTHDYIVEPSPL